MSLFLGLLGRHAKRGCWKPVNLGLGGDELLKCLGGIEDLWPGGRYRFAMRGGGTGGSNSVYMSVTHLT